MRRACLCQPRGPIESEALSKPNFALDEKVCFTDISLTIGFAVVSD
jgi:hypothetical protein